MLSASQEILSQVSQASMFPVQKRKLIIFLGHGLTRNLVFGVQCKKQHIVKVLLGTQTQNIINVQQHQTFTIG